MTWFWPTVWFLLKVLAFLFVLFGLELPFRGSLRPTHAPWMETANPADSLLADVHQSQRTTRSV